VARQAEEFLRRKAPYAPMSALREFFERIRNVSPPARVDRRFFQKLSVAGSNEWALLSALKFLGIVDDNGVPTAAYRALQTSDRFEYTLQELVLEAYRPLFDAGGDRMSVEDLRNYFRVTSSPSQAKNAARFFREVSQLAGLDRAAPNAHVVTGGADPIANYNTNVSPVTLVGCVAPCPPVVLSGSATVASNYPVAGVQAAFLAAVGGTLPAGGTKRIELLVAPLAQTRGPWTMSVSASGSPTAQVRVDANTAKAAITIMAS